MPMSTKHNTARMRSLATDLVDLRTAADLNTREAAKLVGMSASTLNRLENGGKIIEPEHVSALCVAYGVTGAERERLLSLSREPHMPGWWETSGEAIPGQLSALVRFESEATRIVHAAMLLIPGLLQTAEYCRAIMTAAGVVGSTREARVATRLGRQAILSKPKPPSYLAILDEATLRRAARHPTDDGRAGAPHHRSRCQAARRRPGDSLCHRDPHGARWQLHRARVRKGPLDCLLGT